MILLLTFGSKTEYFVNSLKMAIKTWIRHIHPLMCLFVTFGLSVYSIYRYKLNEDITFVSSTNFFTSSDAIYPSFTFCILPPFLENKFDERYPDILTHFVEQQQAILVNESDGDGLEY